MENTIPVVVIPGDGIGPEVLDATKRVLGATGLSFEWIEHLAGLAAIKSSNEALPKSTVQAIDEVRLAIKGPTGTPKSKGHRSINVELRQLFKLEKNIRPVKYWEGVPSVKCPELDVVIFRQNTEDLYVGRERWVERGVAEAVARVSVPASRRIIWSAFEYAMVRGRKKVTVVHKANILKLIYGECFLENAKEISTNFPRIEFNDLIVDAATMRLVTRPWEFDVVVTPNLFGDILSDLCAGLANNGLGLAPGANIGTDCAIFEAVHGTADDIAGQNKANPCALILSGAMMLDHLDKSEEAERIRKAIATTIREGIMTGDLDSKNPVSTDRMTDEIIKNMGN